jgi:hypothetical protein
MDEPGGSHTKYSRLAGVERSAIRRARLTRCWVLRERERFLGPGRKTRPGHPDAEPPSDRAGSAPGMGPPEC